MPTPTTSLTVRIASTASRQLTSLQSGKTASLASRHVNQIMTSQSMARVSLRWERTVGAMALAVEQYQTNQDKMEIRVEGTT
jgi:hypothetical protein